MAGRPSWRPEGSRAAPEAEGARAGQKCASRRTAEADRRSGGLGEVLTGPAPGEGNSTAGSSPLLYRGKWWENSPSLGPVKEGPSPRGQGEGVGGRAEMHWALYTYGKF